MTRFVLHFSVLLLSLLSFAPAAFAQTVAVDEAVTADADAAVAVDGTDAGEDSDADDGGAADAPIQDADDARVMLERLAYIQGVVDNKLAERSALGERIEAANEQDKNDLRRQADELTAEIRELRATLETLATGGIDSSLFVEAPVEEEGDWREDVALIAQPVIDSLKELTEKPRRIAELNETIAEHQREFETAERALAGLAPELALEPEGSLGRALASLERTWTKRRDDARDAIEIARFQIAELQGDKSLPQTIWEAIVGFVTGRGLTLLLAVLAALGVWAGVRFLMRGYRKNLVDKSEPESRTRYRLAEYSVHALTFLLILVAVFVVFYERGDVLLLGLLILLLIGLALAVRQLLPQYVREARLLLNIGPVREAERVIYRGLPWRVESINMFTVLRNPELHGVLRIPLAEFHQATSRPAGRDAWFPTSRGGRRPVRGGPDAVRGDRAEPRHRRAPRARRAGPQRHDPDVLRDDDDEPHAKRHLRRDGRVPRRLPPPAAGDRRGAAPPSRGGPRGARALGPRRVRARRDGRAEGRRRVLARLLDLRDDGQPRGEVAPAARADDPGRVHRGLHGGGVDDPLPAPLARHQG